MTGFTTMAAEATKAHKIPKLTAYHPDTLTNLDIKHFQTSNSLTTHVHHLICSKTSPSRRF